MKIYTSVFDLSRPSPHRFWVTPFSDFKFGIKLVNAGAEVENTFTVTAGTTTLTPDADKIDGFTIYTTKSTDTGFVEYTITVNGIQQRFKLIQIITDSTVFEVGGEGGDVPEDVATKTWVNSQISDFVTDDALTAYATKDELTAYAETSDLTAYATKDELTGYVEEDELTAYATKDELTAYAETSDLTAYAQTADLTAYAEKTDLTAYYTKSETSSATEISSGLIGKITGGAETGTTGTPAAITAMKSVYESDWATLSASAISSTFYVVLPDPA